jgi:hypothetical protein
MDRQGSDYGHCSKFSCSASSWTDLNCTAMRGAQDCRWCKQRLRSLTVGLEFAGVTYPRPLVPAERLSLRFETARLRACALVSYIGRADGAEPRHHTHLRDVTPNNVTRNNEPRANAAGVNILFLLSLRADCPFEIRRETTMQKKSIQAVLVVVSVLFVCNVSMFAQAPQEPAAQGVSDADAQPHSLSDQDVEMLRADIRAQRKQIVAQNMNLTADEATKFWPIFEQYRKEAIKPNDERWAVIKDYAANHSTMTDAQAFNYIKRLAAVDEELIALRLRYVAVFEKVISPKKTALWYQIDRRIDLLINLQLSTQIPMVETSK